LKEASAKRQLLASIPLVKLKKFGENILIFTDENQQFIEKI